MVNHTYAHLATMERISNLIAVTSDHQSENKGLALLICEL